MTPRRATAADLVAVLALQQAAYARNRTILGVEPLPLQADYAEIFRSMEVWVVEAEDATGHRRIVGALILEPHAGHMLIWSIATTPGSQSAGTGKRLLAFAEVEARARGLAVMRLYTGTKLTHLVAWYGRHGYVTERVEELPDRSVTHMVKSLS